MHRSGTSAVAGTAVRLGLSPPAHPIPASDDNPAGFYESAPVVELNHQLLVDAGAAWNLCLNFEPDRLSQRLTFSDRQSIADTLRAEFGAAKSFVMKDPRLCLTLPAWLPALRMAGATVSVLLVVRHPREVVQSLTARNQLPEEQTAPNWLHHVLEAERLSRRLNRAVVFYDDLLQDWRGCMADAGRTAGIDWPNSFDDATPDVERFLAAPSRPRPPFLSAKVGPPLVRDMIDAVWVALRRLREDPRSPTALPCLDHVRREFARWRQRVCPPGTRAVFERPAA